MSKNVILYAYYQTAISAIILRRFVKFGLKAEDTDYYFLLNNQHNYIDELEQNNKNVKIVYYKNAKSSWDKWNRIVRKLKNEYKHYIFIKDKMVGPFVPDNYDLTKWVELVTSNFDDTYKFFSSMINPLIKGNNTCCPHLQINFWATDNIGLNYLINHGMFNVRVRKREYLLLDILRKSEQYKAICYYEPFRNFDITHIHKNFDEIYFKTTNKNNKIKKEKNIFRIYPNKLLFVRYQNVFIKIKNKSIHVIPEPDDNFYNFIIDEIDRINHIDIIEKMNHIDDFKNICQIDN